MELLLILIVSTTILVSLPVHSSVIRPSKTTDIVNCDGFHCPEGSRACRVSQIPSEFSAYKYIRVCVDEFGVPTDAKIEESENHSPTTTATVVVDIVSKDYEKQELSRSGLKELEEQVEKLVFVSEKIVRDANKIAIDATDYWNNWAVAFSADMRKQFPSSFPFV